MVPGLWQLRLPLAWEGIGSVNAFAIARDDGVMLVDCGSAGDPSYRHALALALDQAGFGLRDVRVLAGTHTHSDHVGMASWVIGESGCELAMHPATAHFYDAMRDPAGIEAARERRSRQEGVPEDVIWAYRDVREETEGVLAPVEPHRQLHDGVRLASRLGEWEVVETPGHAPSHVCLFQRDHGIAVVADLVSRTFSPYFDYGYTPDPVAEYLASLDRVAAISGIEVALPGHGRPIADLADVIAEHREGVHEGLAACRRAVAAGPAGGFDLTTRVYGAARSLFVAVWQLAGVACYLRHLRLSGQVTRETAPDGTFRYRTTGDARASVVPRSGPAPRASGPATSA